MAKAYSITATLISSVETFTPVIAAIAGTATGSAWRLIDAPLGHALGARGAHEVLLQVLAQRGLGDAQDERGQRQRDQQPRDPHRLQELQRVLAERHVVALAGEERQPDELAEFDEK